MKNLQIRRIVCDNVATIKDYRGGQFMGTSGLPQSSENRECTGLTSMPSQMNDGKIERFCDVMKGHRYDFTLK